MFRIILICLLTCCSSFMPLKQSESIVNEDYNQVVEKKTRENVIENGSYYFISYSDFVSPSFWGGVIEQWGYTNYNDSVVGNVRSIFSLYDVYLVTWDNINLYNIDSMISNSYNLSGYPTLTCVGKQLYTNNNMWWNLYSINFSFGGNSDTFRLYQLSSTLSSSTGGFTFQYNSSFLPAFNGDYYVFSSNSYFKEFCDKVSSLDYQQGYQNGYDSGYNTGYDVGYNTGYDEGEDRGIEIAEDPASETYQNTFDYGYQTGFQAGVDETIASGNEAMIIFSGIMDVAFIPVNVFFLMFNYEVFGINIAGFVSGLLTIAIVLIIFKFILGRKV